MKTKIPTMADYHKVLKEQGLGSIQKPFLVVPKEERDVLVLDQLAVLYPEKGEQMFIWWLQARNAGLVDDK